TKYYFPNELLLGIAVDLKSQVNISSRSRKVFEFKEGIPHVKSNTNYHLDNLFFPDNAIGRQLAGKSGLFYADSGSIFGATTNIKSVTEVSDSILLVSTGSTLREVKLKSSAEIQMTKLTKKYICLGSSPNGEQYAATKQESGLLNEDYSMSPLYFQGKSFVSKSIASNDEFVFFGTTSDGVLFFQNDSCVQQLSVSNGLSSNKIKRLEVANNKLFVLSFQGMQIYDLKEKRILTLDIPEGVRENQTTNFTINESDLWLLEREAVLHLDLNTINFNRKSGSLVIDSIVFNGEHQTSDFDNLHHSNRSLNIYYDYRDILGLGETEVLYRLIGASDEWKKQRADQFKLELNGLIPGRYSLEVKTLYRGVETNHSKTEFRILPPVYLRWWFLLLASLFIIGITWFLIKRRIKRIERDAAMAVLQERLKQNGLELNLKVLRAQMNPHFIFNSINSIQDLILKEETLKSYDYLVVFSKLVRRILEFSEQDFVTIDEELDFLQDYLMLEKLRFKQDFSFKIINKNCPDNTKIPSLIVQPLVENAIKHGLMHKTGSKHLKVTFEMNSTSIACLVKDNGIGMEESQRINARRHSHRSFSTNAIHKRLSLLSKQVNGTIDFELVDLTENSSVLGTEARLLFPSDL
ncbi:MAG: histidine kinase, partial [Bacteroidota bacterium]